MSSHAAETAMRAGLPAWWTSLTGGHESALWRVTMALCACGLAVLASAARTVGQDLLLRQALWMLAGLVAAWGIQRASYQRWLDVSIVGYAVMLAILGIVLVAGRVSHGASRWLALGPFSIQPAELAKLATALCLARVLGTAMAGSTTLTMRQAALGWLIGGVPAALVFVQPDLGSASVFLWMTAVMLWLAGWPKRYFALGAVAALAVAPLALHALHEYQRQRLLVFLNPSTDPLGSGYTIIQSRIAIGSGGWWGKGWFSGTQAQLRFLPEHHTDFIFAVAAEEWGVLGSAALIGLFAYWCRQGWRVAMLVREPQGRLLVGGIVAWQAYHMVVNLGMTMGVFPVVGIPLPLISYGGSAVLATLLGVGVIESVRRWSPRF